MADAIAIAERVAEVAAAGGAEEYARQVVPLLGHRALLHLGRAEDALRNQRASAIRVLPLAHVGRRAEVWAHLEEFVVRRPGFGTAVDETPTYLDVFRLEAAVLVGHMAAAAKLVERLAACAHVTTGVRLPTCIGRHLGGGCALLGRYAEAEVHYRAALDLATAIRFRPEAALCHLDLAELVLARQEREDRLQAERLRIAKEHLAKATPEFEAMCMQPALERARELATRVQSMDLRHYKRTDRVGLTPREVEIVRLVATGKSNDEIATALVISVRTAERHLANIYAKLGTGGAVARASASAYAHTQGLVQRDTQHT